MRRGGSPFPEGFQLLPGHIPSQVQSELVDAVRTAVRAAPLFRPEMPRTGKPFSVRMTNLGPLGWVSDRDGGYRYQPTHPLTGLPWPAIPHRLLDLWGEVSGCEAPPEACLVNWYDAGARMGLHVDADEAARDVAVVSVSLGDTAVFRVGGPARGDPTRSLRLMSGDVLVMGGASRRCHHGVDRVIPGSSALLSSPGRINLTLRRVSHPG